MILDCNNSMRVLITSACTANCHLYFDLLQLLCESVRLVLQFHYRRFLSADLRFLLFGGQSPQNKILPLHFQTLFPTLCFLSHLWYHFYVSISISLDPFDREIRPWTISLRQHCLFGQ